MRKFLTSIICLLIIGLMNKASSQTYNPIAVTGYTQDGIAESGTSSLAVTTTGLDIQQKILYSKNFATTNGIQLGIDNSGTITSGTATWQLAPYNQNNCIFMSGSSVPNTSSTGSFNVVTPAAFSKISLLGFSTEQAGTYTVTLGFTDGTTASLGNVAFKDWFGGTPFVVQGVGRLLRQVAGPYTVDGLSGGTGVDPRFYRFDLTVPCASQSKLLQSINFAYVSATGAATRTVLLAVSGASYSPLVITPTITDASCGQSNGSIALAVSGGTSPYGYIWNTTPVQAAANATNLAAGTYTATITDAGGCVTPSTHTVNQSSSGITLTATASPSTICTGETSTLTATLTGATATTFTWSPSSLTGQTVTLPAATATGATTHTVTTTANGCTLTATTTVTVNQKPTSTFAATPATICLGTTNTVTYTGNGTATGTYTWNFNGAAVQSGTGAGPYNILYNAAGSKVLTLQVTENGCTSSITPNNIDVTAPPSANFTVSSNAICSGQSINVTYNATPSSTATATWQWGGGTPTGTGFGPYTVVYNNTGNISLTATDGPCTVTSAVQMVTVTQQPVASFTAGQLIACPSSSGMNVNFTNTSTNTVTGTTIYLWNFGDGNTSSSFNASNTYTNAPPASFPVTLTVVTGSCTSTSPAQTVQLVKPPVADFIATPTTGTPIQLSQAHFSFLNQSTDATNYKWLFGNGDTSIVANPAYTYPNVGNYTVSLIASNSIGCVDTTFEQYFVVVPDSSLIIPNAFSPNGDGKNEYWVITGLSGYPYSKVNVFNRGGQEVFTSTGYKTPWDGRFKGSPVPVGTYYYIILANGIKYTGWLLVLR